MNSILTTWGSDFELPELGFTPPKGYVFDKWDLGMVGEKITISGNAVLKALWNPIPYEVSFDPDGGSGEMKSVSADFGTEYELPQSEFAPPAEKVFDGWDAGAAGEKITISGDLILKAVWKDAPLSVSFDPNGGSGEMKSVRMDFNAEYELPECDFEPPMGKVFDKWDLGAAGESVVITGDTVLKAIWRNSIYTVSFNANGGSGEMPSVEAEYGSSFCLPESEFTSPGDAPFYGWDLGKAGEIITISGNTVLNAVWRYRDCTVSFNGNGGSGGMESLKIEWGTELVLPESGFTAPGDKKFGGWDKGKPGERLTILEDTTLEAVWGYELSFDANGGSGEMESVIIDAQNGSSLPESSFAPPEGYVFHKWDLGKAGEIVTIPRDMVTKAIWIEARNTVSFNANGGTGSMDSVSMDTGSEYALPECEFNPPAGYEFDKWDLGRAGDRITVSEDTLIKAEWTNGHYTVSFNANGGSGEMKSVSAVGPVFILPQNEFTAPEGLVFGGWGLGDSGEEIVISQNLILNAEWRRPSYTVNFDANGGSGRMESEIVEGDARGTKYVLPKSLFTSPDPDLTFAGWNLGRDGDSIDISGDITLKALWGYRADFDPGEGSRGESSLYYQGFEATSEDRELTLPECDFTAPEGMTFLQWRAYEPKAYKSESSRTQTEGLIGAFKPGEKLTLSQNMVMAAQWTIKDPKITLDKPAIDYGDTVEEVKQEIARKLRAISGNGAILHEKGSASSKDITLTLANGSPLPEQMDFENSVRIKVLYTDPTWGYEWSDTLEVTVRDNNGIGDNMLSLEWGNYYLFYPDELPFIDKKWDKEIKKRKLIYLQEKGTGKTYPVKKIKLKDGKKVGKALVISLKFKDTKAKLNRKEAEALGLAIPIHAVHIHGHVIANKTEKDKKGALSEITIKGPLGKEMDVDDEYMTVDSVNKTVTFKTHFQDTVKFSELGLS